jgi:hypothetical protein
MHGTEPEDSKPQGKGVGTAVDFGTEGYGESAGVRGFATGLGLHFFGIPVMLFLMWCLMRLSVQNPEASGRAWFWTLGTAGVTQAVYMLPAYFIAKYKDQPKAYRTGLLVSALGLFVLNVMLVYFFLSYA